IIGPFVELFYLTILLILQPQDPPPAGVVNCFELLQVIDRRFGQLRTLQHFILVVPDIHAGTDRCRPDSRRHLLYAEKELLPIRTECHTTSFQHIARSHPRCPAAYHYLRTIPSLPVQPKQCLCPVTLSLRSKEGQLPLPLIEGQIGLPPTPMDHPATSFRQVHPF